jgi:hypothetical protein
MPKVINSKMEFMAVLGLYFLIRIDKPSITYENIEFLKGFLEFRGKGSDRVQG